MGLAMGRGMVGVKTGKSLCFRHKELGCVGSKQLWQKIEKLSHFQLLISL